jgi:hypothetical protein
MKFKLIILTASFFCLAYGSAMASDAKETSRLLSKIEQSLPERYRDPAAIVERRVESWMTVDGFSELRSSIQNDWESHIGNIREIAPTQNAQAIYFKAAEVLNKNNYYKLILSAADEAALGNVELTEFRWIVFPIEKHLRDMWTEDPPSAELKAVAARVREVMGADSGVGKFMTQVIAGEIAASNRGFAPDTKPLRPAFKPPTPQAVNPSLALPPAVPVAPQPQRVNRTWWIVGAIAALAALVVVARRKKSRF